MHNLHTWAALPDVAAPQHELHVSLQARTTSRKRLRQVSPPSQENTMASAFPSFTQFPRTAALSHDDPVHESEGKRGLLSRLLDGLIEARRREAEQQVARLLGNSGKTRGD